MNDEADLLARARAGERSAYAALVSPLRERLLRYAALMGGGEGAEDLVQEAIARGFDGLERFRGEARFSTWLHGILHNLCRAARRRRRETSGDHPAIGQAAAPRGRSQGVLSTILRREVAERAEAAISRLPSSFREAFLLRYVEGLSYAEAAGITGEREATLRTRAHRARALLRDELGDLVDTAWVRG